MFILKKEKFILIMFLYFSTSYFSFSICMKTQIVTKLS